MSVHNQNNRLGANTPDRAPVTPGVRAIEDSLQLTVQGRQQQADMTKTGQQPVPECYVSLEPIEWPNKDKQDTNMD